MPVNAPTTSRITMFAASLAAPLAAVATWAIALFILFLGVIKLIPSDGASESASAALLRLSTGGVIDAPWGVYLIGGLQVAIGLGLLVPPSRALAGLACLLSAVVVVIGAVMHLDHVVSGNSLTAAGVALLALVVLLVAGAALGTRGAAKRLGAAV
jgi:hypothetical protein